MTLIVRPARPTDVYQFGHFDTPAAPPHVAEVEQWIRRYAWAWVRTPADAEDRQLLVGDLNTEIVAVGAHVLVEPSVRYVMAVAVHHDHRGRGLGREFVSAVVEHARDRTPGAAIFGLVASDNDVMLHLAESLGGSPGDVPGVSLATPLEVTRGEGVACPRFVSNLSANSLESAGIGHHRSERHDAENGV